MTRAPPPPIPPGGAGSSRRPAAALPGWAPILTLRRAPHGPAALLLSASQRKPAPRPVARAAPHCCGPNHPASHLPHATLSCPSRTYNDGKPAAQPPEAPPTKVHTPACGRDAPRPLPHAAGHNTQPRCSVWAIPRHARRHLWRAARRWLSAAARGGGQCSLDGRFRHVAPFSPCAALAGACNVEPLPPLLPPACMLGPCPFRSPTHAQRLTRARARRQPRREAAAVTDFLPRVLDPARGARPPPCVLLLRTCVPVQPV
ncbi:MAG: hypothetical protein J3K34DRAFT_412839 [Monoraphidium minutum]|nr:MAG: hypothetical protein J3K34DRAFT_412839 [Monoraphidium minutum]